MTAELRSLNSQKSSNKIEIDIEMNRMNMTFGYNFVYIFRVLLSTGVKHSLTQSLDTCFYIVFLCIIFADSKLI